MRLFLTLMMFSMALFASEQKIDPAEMNKIQQPVKSSSKMIKDIMQEYLESNDYTTGKNPGTDKTFYTAKATVSVSDTSAHWAKARSAAFTEAVLSLRTQYIVDYYSNPPVVEEILSNFADSSSDARQFAEDEPVEKRKARAEKVIDKAIHLADAKLTNALQEEGADMEEYEQASPEKKKVLAMKVFAEKVKKRAFGNVAGMLVIQSFEAKDSKGKTTIGVIGMHSDKLRQLAYDISKGNKPLLKKAKCKTIREQIPRDPRVLKSTMGVRILFNENGMPCIVSYGQHSHSYSGSNERTLDRMIDIAEKQALTKADADIVKFLNSNIAFTEEMETGTKSGEILRLKDGFENIENVETVIDKFNEQVKSRSSADISGVSTVYKWDYKTPQGHDIVGAIRVWTYDTAQAVKSARNWKPDLNRRSANPKESNGATEAKIEVGAEQIDINDF